MKRSVSADFQYVFVVILCLIVETPCTSQEDNDLLHQQQVMKTNEMTEKSVNY